MADDMNSYALNLAFQLSAAPAIASLNDILTSFEGIQSEIKKISDSISGTITSSLATIQEQVAKVSSSSTNLSKNFLQYETSLAGIEKHHEEIDRLNTKAAKFNLKSFLDFDKTRKWFTQFLKENRLLSVETKTQAKQQEQITSAIKNNLTYSRSISNQSENQTPIVESVAAAWCSVNNAMHGVIDGGVMQSATGERVAAAWHGVSQGIVGAIVGFAEMLIGIQALKVAFSGFIDEEIRFSTANYRLYGSQGDIIKQVNKTTVAYGLMRKQVLEAYVALGGVVRAYRGELEGLVVTNVQFSLILGTNQKDLGLWQMAMRGVGFGVRESESILIRYALIMRNLGMSAAQLSKILNSQAQSAVSMVSVYGTEGTKDLNEFINLITAMGNKAKMSEEQTTAMAEGMRNAFNDVNIQPIIASMSELSDIELDSIDKELQAAAKQRSGFNAAVKSMYAIYGDGSKISAFQTAAFTKQAALYGQSYDAMVGHLKIFAKTSTESGNAYIKTNDDIIKSNKKLRDSILNGADEGAKKALLLKESMDSLARHFEASLGEMSSALSDLMVALKPAMVFFIDYIIYPIIWAIKKLVQLITLDFASAFSTASNAVDKTVESLKPVLSWSQIIGGALTSLIIAAGIFSAFWFGFTPMLGLWQAFWAAVSSVKLLSLAIAAIAVGGAFLLVANAFKILADLGWSIVGPLVATVVVIGLLTYALPPLTAALVTLGTVGWAGIVAMLALSVAFTIVAFAVLVLSWAFNNITESLVSLYETTGGAWGLIGLGAALIVFGIELGVAAATIGIGSSLLAIACIPLLIAMGALAVAMLVVDGATDTIDKLGDGRLQRFGDALVSLAPGIGLFIAAMGTGFKFSLAMGAIARSIFLLDPVRIYYTAISLQMLGDALEKISKFNIDNLSNIGGSILLFTNQLVDIFDALTLAVDRAIISIIAGFFGITFVAWQLEAQMIGAFISLLTVIPVITNITDAIAYAIESGQEKIKSQIDALSTSFLALQSISNRLGVTTNIKEQDKKKVMAETISTIQLKTETSGSSDTRWKQEEEQVKQTEIMSTIAAAVSKLGGGNDVSVIKTLLQTYLPKIGESPSKLSTRLNSWA
jgi:hypothetical protein